MCNMLLSPYICYIQYLYIYLRSILKYILELKYYKGNGRTVQVII